MFLTGVYRSTLIAQKSHPVLKKFWLRACLMQILDTFEKPTLKSCVWMKNHIIEDILNKTKFHLHLTDSSFASFILKLFNQLPVLASTGHHNYAKCAYLHL